MNSVGQRQNSDGQPTNAMVGVPNVTVKVPICAGSATNGYHNEVICITIDFYIHRLTIWIPIKYLWVPYATI